MATFSGLTNTTIPISGPWKGVAYGNGIFVAVSSGSGIMYSTDGRTWNAVSIGEFFNCVTYGNGKFVAIASSVIWISTDGREWTRQSGNLPSDTSWHCVAYGNGRFVAMASTGISAYSTDGISWSVGSPIISGDWTAIIYTGSRFVAVGWRAIYTSENGSGWTNITPVDYPDSWLSIAYGNGVLIASGGTYKLRSTDGGVTWKQTPMPHTYYYGVTYANGVFVAVTQGDKYCVYSTDGGVTWTTVALPVVATWLVVTDGATVAAIPQNNTTAVYAVINSAPSVPNSITVPTSIEGGTSIGVSWGASTDADGNLAGYILERSVDGGEWTQIYRGALSSFTDAITFGWTSVTYRVKAYDAFSSESAYTTSATRSVKNNEPPTISGTDGDLGTFGTSFTSQFYTIMDPQADAVSVVERVDGVVKRSYNASLGGSNTFSFAQAEWRQVLNGKHTITITATDSKGAQTVRTWTFTKSVTTLTFTITPLPADAMPDRCVVQAVGGFPEGSSLKVEVSNNANDASPFWEDVSAKLGKKHFFANTAKTASAWGFGLRVTLKRNTATGAVWLDYITINYR